MKKGLDPDAVTDISDDSKDGIVISRFKGLGEMTPINYGIQP